MRSQIATPAHGTLRYRVLDAVARSNNSTVVVAEIASKIEKPAFVVSTTISMWILEIGTRCPIERVARGNYRLRKS